MMSSIILMSHDLSQPIRIVALDEIQTEREMPNMVNVPSGNLENMK